MSIPRNLSKLADGADASGVLGVSNGGTGLTAVGSAGTVLVSNGSAASWSPPSGPSITAVASGSLADGSTVIVNSDGTVSAVAVGDPSASATLFGSAASISGTCNFRDAIFDTTSNKVVVLYTNSSSYPVVAVGTISGTTITFGTPVVAYSLDASYAASMTYIPAQNKVFIVFTGPASLYSAYYILGTVSGTSINFGFGNAISSFAYYPKCTVVTGTSQIVVTYCGTSSQYGYAVVGTVSGTTVTFGTPVVYLSAQVRTPQVVYDNAAGKALVTYFPASPYNLNGIAGTISGNSISFGTPTTLAGYAFGYNYFAAVYDVNASKTAFFGVMSGGGIYALTASISGTTVSFGTPAVIFATAADYLSAVYMSNSKKIAFTFRDSSATPRPKVAICTISGTAISSGTPVTIADVNASFEVITYDSNLNRCVTAYTLNTGGTGEAKVAYGSNLTTANFIGFSNGVYTNGQTATIQTIGSVDDAQTGLTAGSSYYVQTNGSLATTPESGVSVFAGTAISSTKIITKG